MIWRTGKVPSRLQKAGSGFDNVPEALLAGYGAAVMLDALKFAFEILVVGALALPWLAILKGMLPSDPSSGPPSYLSVLPRSARSTVAVAVVVAFGYVAGSTVSRASRDLMNDELLKPIPTEDTIRDAVYQDEYCGQDLIDLDEYLPFFDQPSPAPKSKSSDKSSLSEIHQKLRKDLRQAFCPGQDTPERLDAHITEMFSLQEGELLLLGQDRVDRLKQYYDQINVLRGAALNGFILFVVCVFGCCGNLRERKHESRVAKWLSFLPAGLLLFCGSYSLLGHFRGLSLRAQDLYSTTDPTLREVLRGLYSDPPFAELVLLLLGAAGIFVTAKARKEASYLRTGLLAATITLVCFGGWWWTEVMYDLQVIHSQIELHPVPVTAGPSPAIGTAPGNGSESQPRH
jgi:hypothetical protein